MAYMSQEKKKQIAPKVKAILKEYGLKGSLSVCNYSTLVLKIKSGKVDFAADHLGDGEFYYDINPYHYGRYFGGVSREVLDKLFVALNDGNHDNSDPMTDYFDVGWYVDVKIGLWNKKYELVK